jgi:copper(I)-binding protein
MTTWKRWNRWIATGLAVLSIPGLSLGCGPGMPGGAAVGPKVRIEDVWSRAASAMVTITGAEATTSLTGTIGMTAGAAMSGSAAMTASGSNSMTGGVTAPTDHPPRGNGAVYFTVVNEGGADDRVVRAETDVAENVELHQTRMDNGVMKMEPVQGGIEVPAGGKVELKPGSYHVMLLGLRHDLNPGDRFPVMVELEKSGAITVEATVRQP